MMTSPQTTHILILKNSLSGDCTRAEKTIKDNYVIVK